MAAFTNQATLSYSGRTVSSNVVSGEVLEVLSATKTPVSDSYVEGDIVTYVVSLNNTGATAFNGLTLNDDLGAYVYGDDPTTEPNEGTTVYPLTFVPNTVLYYVNGVLQATPTVASTEPLSITGLSVPAGGNASIVYAARVNAFASPEDTGSIVNTATFSGGGITPVSAEGTVTASQDANLRITKSLSPNTVPENGVITYTFLIQNFGNAAADAADNVAITDVFNPILSDIVVTYNGTTWTAPTNYTYDEDTGTFSTVPGQIVVPAATYTRDTATGEWVITPGVSTVTVRGTV